MNTEHRKVSIIMKTIHKSVKLLFLLLFIFISSTTSIMAATTLADDTFDAQNDLEGYYKTFGTGDIRWTYSSGTGWMVIDRDTTARKDYNFGTNYANKTVTIEVGYWVPYSWESSDKFRVRTNGTWHNYYNEGGYEVITLDVPLDSNGKLDFRLRPVTDDDDKIAYVNYVKITVLSEEETCPGSVLLNLDGTTVTVSENKNNIVIPADTAYYYHFTPNADGTIQADSFSNGYYNYLFVRDGCGNYLWVSDSDGQNKSSPEIDVSAGQTIVIGFYNPYSYYDLTTDFEFTYTVNQPLTISNIPNQTVQAEASITPIDTVVSGGTPDYSYSISGLNGLSIDSNGRITGSADVANTGIYTVTVTVTDSANPAGSTDTDFNITVTPLAKADEFTVGSDTQLNEDTVSNDIVTSPVVTLLSDVSHGDLILNADGSFEYRSDVGYTGDDSFEYKIEGTYGEDTAIVTIHVISTDLIAVDDVYNTTGTASVTGNVMANDTPSSGPTAILTSSSTGTLGGVLNLSSDGSFTYTPGGAGTEIFTYQISITLDDGTVKSDSATITFNVDTDYQTGVQPFRLINPSHTRNIIGSYQIAGNTVMCLTTKTSGYADATDQCQDANYLYYTSNMRVSKYLDIDNDSSTWNSTSSYVELPDNYTQIAWAGLFWQGRISRATSYVMHYGKDEGSSYDLIETGKGSNYPPVTLENENVNKLRLKINNGGYSQVTASTIYNIGSDTARTYAAFADVTALVRNAALEKGKNTFTVANLVTNEGRESSPGVFGGWALVVIYMQDYATGSPQNISIYSGFDSVGRNNPPIDIYGFRLPSGTNSVTANLSLFSGEGEYRYGRTPENSSEDWIKISDEENSGYDYMPGLADGTGPGNKNNVFDATFSGIKRDHIDGEFNDLQVNNDGVDVDTFDLSDVITGYRNDNPDIAHFYIKYYSNNDYITPSMIAFSTELYQPKICYDYTVEIGGYTLQSENNQIKTPFPFNTTLPLTTRVTVRSDEGDFPLEDVNITYVISDTNQLHYINGSTAIAPNGIHTYMDADNLTYAEGASGFGMYINDPSAADACNNDASCGGDINSYERRYIKFQDELQTSSINTDFRLYLQYTVDYGSGPVPQYKQLDATSLCDADAGYTPAWDAYNVASDEADTSNGQPYNLYTQVSNRPFDARVFHYDKDPNTGNFTIPSDTNASVEVEVFNASFFPRDINVSCLNPDSNITDPAFVRFDWSSPGTRHNYVNLPNVTLDFAIRNAGFRVWKLVKSDGITPVDHQCDNRADETCFRNVYNQYYAGDDTHCTENCSAGGSDCYACLRKFYGVPICSRDNFAVRPEAFVTTISDSNQSNEATDPKVNIAYSKIPTITANITNSANLIAGYKYRFDVNATNYLNDRATARYYQSFTNESDLVRSYMAWDNNPPSGIDNSACNVKEDRNISLVFFNGSTINPNTNKVSTESVDEIGEYKFELFDQNWTAVDWHTNLLTHHDRSGFDNTDTDCIYDNDQVVSPTQTGKQGCVISSVHNHPNGNQYTTIDLRFYPYTFDMTPLSFGGGPNMVNDFVYINTLDKNLYPNGINEEMSYNIRGVFNAKGWGSSPSSGKDLTNFVNGCYAEDIEMNLWATYLSTKPAITPDFTYSLIDFNSTDPSITYPSGNTNNRLNDTIEGTFNNAQNKGTPFNLQIVHQKESFDKTMKGSVDMHLGFNFDRTFNQTLNPRYIHFSDFNITYNSAPQFQIELKNNYQINGTRKVDQNITFVYGRLKANKDFYDDITTNSTETPVSVVAFCDFNITECQNSGMMKIVNGLLSDARTNETEWWFVQKHDSTVNDGNATLISSSNGSVTPADPSILNFTDGIDTNVQVTKSATASTPTVVDIGFGANTNRWLIYNQSTNAIPNIFYRVRFIGNSGWTGQGSTGHVVGDDINQKKTRRLEW